jgi:hypothetical protein
MPQMAKDVSMRGFIALSGVAVKPQLAAKRAAAPLPQHCVKHVGTASKHSADISRQAKIWSKSTIMSSGSKGTVSPGTSRDRQMPRSNKDVRVKQPTLASQYRAIGPAAIAAALLHTPKKQKPVQKFIAPRAA